MDNESMNAMNILAATRPELFTGEIEQQRNGVKRL
jgi:hypothetical protein